MHVYASPPRGTCAACDGAITGATVFHMDEAYCCEGCAQRGPCICLYEQDLADDGVDGMGMPFADHGDAAVRRDAPGALRARPA